MPIRLREYQERDFDALYALDQRCFEPDIAYTRQELHFFIHRVTAITVVAEENGILAGFLIVDHERQKSGHIITIDVAEEYRQRGVGTLLMKDAERRSRSLERKAVLLEVAVNNSPARRFYEKHGYVILRQLPNYYKRGWDALLMGKNL
jgi:ribosomal-protein-alanine N-acetyltransferase